MPLADNLPDPPVRTTTNHSNAATTSYIHPSKRNLIPQIYFATHNINGLRNDVTKLEHLLVYTANHNIDIIVITETNLPTKTAKF